MRRSDEEFKAELMLRVKKHRAVQKRRKQTWITAATAAAGLVIVMAVKMPGIFRISTESLSGGRIMHRQPMVQMDRPKRR